MLITNINLYYRASHRARVAARAAHAQLRTIHTAYSASKSLLDKAEGTSTAEDKSLWATALPLRSSRSLPPRGEQVMYVCMCPLTLRPAVVLADAVPVFLRAKIFKQFPLLTTFQGPLAAWEPTPSTSSGRGEIHVLLYFGPACVAACNLRRLCPVPV